MHLEQLVEVRHLHARPGGDALFAAGLKQRGIGALFLGHRLDHGDLAGQHLVVEAGIFDLFGHLAHAGHHAHESLHAAHLLHLLQLALEVVHVELTLGHAAHHLFGLGRLDGFLCLFHQRHDIAHAEDTARDTLWLEGFDGVHLFAETDKANGLAGDRAHREGGTAAPIAIHPGQDHAGHADLVVKLCGHVDRVLTGQAIDHQQRLARLRHIAHRRRLRDQLRVDVQPARSVEHVDVIAAKRRLGLGAFGDGDRVFALDDGQGIDADLFAKDGQLFHGRRAIGVERRHEHALALAVLEPLGEFGGGGGFTRALQADHEDWRRRVVDLERAGIARAAQGLDQCVMHDLDDLLAGGHGFGDGLPGGAALDGLDEIARDGQRDVRLQERHAHFAQGRFHILFG